MRARVYIITAILLFILDQLSKYAAEEYLKLGDPFVVIPGYFELLLNYNPGIAFGLFANYTTVFALVALVMVIVITWLIRSSRKDQRLFRWALTFQLGGALGNLLDRWLREDGVVDFLNFSITLSGKEYTWPTFNLADVFVVIGTFFLIVYLIKAPPPELVKHPKEPPPAPDEEPPDLEEVVYDIGDREGLEELHVVDELDIHQERVQPPYSEE